MKPEKIFVTGAAGQIGSELVPALREKYGKDNVIALYHHNVPKDAGKHIIGDAGDKALMEKIIKENDITVVYHLVGILSAKGEQNPDLAYNVNMGTLKTILDIAKDRKNAGKPIKIFWPSSIAAFGPTTPRDKTPQKTILEPATMYGVTKVAGELLVNYYFKKFGLDIRGLRYPGIISWKTPPGGGTTDYAVEIFYGALKEKKYTSFLKAGTYLPMMYMDDAVRATIELMEADPSKISIRTSYNITAISFAPEEIAAEIKKHIPEFSISYKDDFRQQIADSWPKSIDDSSARKDWAWKHTYGLAEMTSDMLKNLGPMLK
ncbi:L-arabinose 1-dehydrogenase (NAD(P)(+)) [Candidatus Bilamarchaeum dharawalense]|uniref:L-arabinose 1-dehydrogenase (NAD(P)(+)) n=1 Tax=Candidatus Bilamarchaeum dharawalense TaxID=2885759 RepID=A0A5E4LM04_9ARCH|nr:L-arabinose 1-dehydrogenase (NAD(P)(+)) [Candidatus Bilamarchaeum dharawalense]